MLTLSDCLHYRTTLASYSSSNSNFLFMPLIWITSLLELYLTLLFLRCNTFKIPPINYRSENMEAEHRMLRTKVLRHEMARTKMDRAEMPRVEIPRDEMPRAKMLMADTLRVDTLRVNTQRTYTPRVDTRLGLNPSIWIDGLT
jgi:hypothetical protein